MVHNKRNSLMVTSLNFLIEIPWDGGHPFLYPYIAVAICILHVINLSILQSMSTAKFLYQ